MVTKKLLKSWGLLSIIPEGLLPIEVDQLFEASIPTEYKVLVLLHEEILGRRGLVYVAARAARRACTRTGWSHPASLRSLDLCDRYASGEGIPEEELRAASTAAYRVVTSVSEAASRSACSSSASSSWVAACSSSWAAASCASNASHASCAAFSDPEVESEAQLEDCREWILRSAPKERAPVLSRYQRILRPTW